MEIRKAMEEFLHAFHVSADVGVDFTVGPIQIVLGDDGVAAVAGAADVDHVQIVPDDGSVQVGVNKVLAGAGAPVAHNVLLQMLWLQGGAQQRIVQQIELAGGQIVGCAPPGVNGVELLAGQGIFLRHAGGSLSGSFCGGVDNLWHKLVPLGEMIFYILTLF